MHALHSQACSGLLRYSCAEVSGADLTTHSKIGPLNCSARPCAGLDGCSSPLFLLLSSRLVGSGFLAPTVSTLNKLDNAARFKSMLLTSDGNYSMPTAEELAIAAAPNASSDARPYLGCFSGAGLLMAGTFVGVIDGIPDAGACCRTCREKETCNVWTFCAEPAGCK